MTLGCAVIGLSAWISVCSVSGQVVDMQGHPVCGAQVFAEPGLSRALRATQSGAEGAFRFEEIGDGPVGIFAIAAQYGFGGRHLNLAMSESVSGILLTLMPPGEISGVIADSKGKPIAGARITRIGLLGETKVGIPLGKLKPYGFECPFSDPEGRFSVGHLPQGGQVALKAGHPDYAQEGVENLSVGAADVRITLQPGIMVEGRVLSKGKETPVANASIVVRNGKPPYDTAVTQSDGFGHFSLRLNPGVYLYQAATDEATSAGWEPLTISGQSGVVQLTARVAGSALIRGAVKDAKSGEPIAGARILANSNGNRSAIVYTGPTGEFQVRTAAGETELRMESAPGYLPPETGAIKVAVTEGQDILLPGMWLAPAPRFRVQIMAADGVTPASNVVVSVLRPRQFGWYVSGAGGWVEISMVNLPGDGRIIAMAESLEYPQGALFSLSRDASDGSKAQLLPLARVAGTVVDASGKPLEGVVVGAVFPGETADLDLLLWRCVSNASGAFSWSAVIPGVPQIGVARVSERAVGESSPFTLAPGAETSIGAITIPDGAGMPTWNGKTLPWHENKLLCGPPVAAKAARKTPALVVYCPGSQAEMVIAGLQSVRAALRQVPIQFAVVVSGGYTCGEADLPVLAGTPPGQATTYLIGPDGAVYLETFGLPPAWLLARHGK